MGNVSFTSRLRAAVDDICADESLSLIECASGSLYSPVYRGSKYVWTRVMDTDGLLVAKRRIHEGEGAATTHEECLTLGVIIQSEDATSQTKPNPIGKAALGHIPNGIWARTKDNGRTRIDRFLVLFLLPKGAARNRVAKFETARRNVQNAADMMPDAVAIKLPRGASQTAIRDKIIKIARPFLRGRGRPKGS